MGTTTASAPPDGDLHARAAMLLAAHGQKYTTARRAMVAVLAAMRHPATIAEVLIASPDLAASTTYRNVTVLREAGIVTRVSGADEFGRFELAEELAGSHHHHVTCTNCGLVLDAQSSASLEAALNDSIRDLMKAGGYQITGHRLELVGRCASCR